MNPADFTALAPLLVLAGASVLALLVISFRRHYGLTFALTLAGLTLPILLLNSQSALFYDLPPLFRIDGFGRLFAGLVLSSSLVVAFLAYPYLQKFEDHREEFFVLLLIAALGGVCLAFSTHFVSFFVSLELMSVPIYALAGYTFARERSLEAAAKYLILASASTAFLLFGMALLYFVTGSMAFPEMALAFRQMNEALNHAVLYAGLAGILVGIGFKLSLVPFHAWTPDVYQGAPLPVTTLLATVSKAAVVAVTLRFALATNLLDHPGVTEALALIAAASMLVGNLLALTQTNLKRLLAYSSIAHLGYLTVALLSGGPAGAESAAFYTVAYVLTTLGTFGALTALSTSAAEIETIDDIRGLASTRPVIAALFTAMMLSLAGIPLTAGFLGKFFVLSAGVQEAQWALTLILVAGSAIGLYYYLRVVAALYETPEPDLAAASPSPRPTLPEPSIGLGVLAAVSAVVLGFGLYPAPLLTAIRLALGHLGL